MKITKIISGGQTGADRGGLDAAIQTSIPHGGLCPKGRKAEDGPIPDEYQLTETKSADYRIRTEQNVKDSDATVIFTFGKLSGGSLLTAKFCDKHGKPYLHIDLSEKDVTGATTELVKWLEGLEGEGVLNIAGQRESKSPGLQEAVKGIMAGVLETG